MSVDQLREEFITSAATDPWTRMVMELAANAWVRGYRSTQADIGRLDEEDCTSGLTGTSVAEAMRFLDESSDQDLRSRAMREIVEDKDDRDFVGATAQVARALDEAKAIMADRRGVAILRPEGVEFQRGMEIMAKAIEEALTTRYMGRDDQVVGGVRAIIADVLAEKQAGVERAGVAG